MEVEETQVLWEVSASGRTLHIFEDEHSAKTWANNPTTQKAIKLLSPGTILKVFPISVMRVINQEKSNG